MAYKLDLPIDSNIHPIFHGSQLKKDGKQLYTDICFFIKLCCYSYQVPEEVLDSQLVKKGNTEVVQVLIKWSNMSQELATCEDREDLHQQFPTAHTWGQAAAQDHGSVTASADSAGMTKRKRQGSPI
jgi:hypothetical protein